MIPRDGGIGQIIKYNDNRLREGRIYLHSRSFGEPFNDLG